jgi:alpha,alpha-trehalase
MRAAILDLDGVITQTAHLHAQAWKQMFDVFLQARNERTGEDHAPFDAEADYDEYVDGKLRYDGVRSFLESRGIALPEGNPSDPPDAETICGLGNRKNEIFHALLDERGVEVYDDTVEQLRRWRERGVPTAVISSSRNCEAVLDAAGLHHLFDVTVSGVDSERLGLRGKPAPDIFIEAAQRLDVEPHKVMVFEDARAGVKAARTGGFGLVVGVDREDEGDLSAHGADVVVQDLRHGEEPVSRQKP